METREKIYQKELEQYWPGWKITGQLGQGSFGTVYRIERENFGHIYEAALKVITIPQDQSEVESIRNDGMDEHSVTMYFKSIVEDIVSEFELMSQLKGNSNIVSYEDHIVIPNADRIGWNIYIRMELLTPLYTHVRNNGITIRNIIKLGIDICKALELCQKCNIIHRDIKPENIFVSPLGSFKLGDFGIARQMEKTMSAMSKKGTYAYMAPEVYRGNKYNSTVDIYSLGIVLYRFLNNNRTPFLPPSPQPIRYQDKERANIKRMAGDPMPKPCNAEGRLSEIVLKACAFDPKDRYESALDLRKALESILYTESEGEIIYPNGDEITNDSVKYVDSMDMDSVEKDSISDPEDEEATDPTLSILEKNRQDKEKRRKEEELRKKEEEERKRLEEERKKEEAKKLEEERLKAEAEAKRLEEERKKKEELQRAKEEAKRKKEEEKRQKEIQRQEEKRKKEEERKNKKKAAENKNTKKIIAAVLTLALAGGAGFGGYSMYQKSLEREVPNLYNKTLKVAVAEAAGDDESLIVVKSGEQYSDTVAKGNIISQNVKEGEILKKGDTVEVVVSKGALVTVPTLVGKAENKAKEKATKAKLQFNVSKKVYSDKVKKGYAYDESFVRAKQNEKVIYRDDTRVITCRYLQYEYSDNFQIATHMKEKESDVWRDIFNLQSDMIMSFPDGQNITLWDVASDIWNSYEYIYCDSLSGYFRIPKNWTESQRKGFKEGKITFTDGSSSYNLLTLNWEESPSEEDNTTILFKERYNSSGKETNSKRKLVLKTTTDSCFDSQGIIDNKEWSKCMAFTSLVSFFNKSGSTRSFIEEIKNGDKFWTGVDINGNKAIVLPSRFKKIFSGNKYISAEADTTLLAGLKNYIVDSENNAEISTYSFTENGKSYTSTVIFPYKTGINTINLWSEEDESDKQEVLQIYRAGKSAILTEYTFAENGVTVTVPEDWPSSYIFSDYGDVTLPMENDGKHYGVSLLRFHKEDYESEEDAENASSVYWKDANGYHALVFDTLESIDSVLEQYVDQEICTSQDAVSLTEKYGKITLMLPNGETYLLKDIYEKEVESGRK